MSESTGGCPVTRAAHPTQGGGNRGWWPNRLNLTVLAKNQPVTNPMGEAFDYGAAFKTLDLAAVKADIAAVLTDSKDWWPADYGHYGPFMIRMAWHAAGTYRTIDGRGGAGSGQLRFAPLNSWPDNGNLDKARRLLWPVKKKYGAALSWADLHVLTGNVALESMGFTTYGFAGGRPDVYEAEEDVYWGPEQVWLDDQRYSGDRELENPLGAVQMGLIYVNPAGPNGNPDPLASARDIRETFGRMAMDDEETVALVAGGHTFGKAHGAGDPALVGAEPEGTLLEQQGLGWKNAHGTGKAGDTTTSGFEGAWNSTPITWDNNYFDTLFGYEWELTTSPAGAPQWTAIGGEGTVPDAHDPTKRHAPFMTTADLAMRMDPIYGPISKRFHENPDQFADAFARAWYKLTHRDMGPVARYLGAEVPSEELIWQDPIPAGTPLSDAEVATLKAAILASDLTVSQLVSTAWAAASCFRLSDKRGGANGGRIRLEPQSAWEVNNPSELAVVIRKLDEIAAESGIAVSFADMVVLGGAAAVEKAAAYAGYPVSVDVSTGRGDATQDKTDVNSFAVLEPTVDGFRNYLGKGQPLPAEALLVDKANLLGLSAPEMAVLVGGLRVLGANYGGSALGVFTERPGQLTNDFFVNLLDYDTTWAPTSVEAESFNGTDASGAVKWTGSRVDLVFGSNSELRAIAEVYGADDAGPKFAADFAAAFAKVMDADRYDLKV